MKKMIVAATTDELSELLNTASEAVVALKNFVIGSWEEDELPLTEEYLIEAIDELQTQIIEMKNDYDI